MEFQAQWRHQPGVSSLVTPGATRRTQAFADLSPRRTSELWPTRKEEHGRRWGAMTQMSGLPGSSHPRHPASISSTFYPGRMMGAGKAPGSIRVWERFIQCPGGGGKTPSSHRSEGKPAGTTPGLGRSLPLVPRPKRVAPGAWELGGRSSLGRQFTEELERGNGATLTPCLALAPEPSPQLNTCPGLLLKSNI